jgi:hypothetical protein
MYRGTEELVRDIEHGVRQEQFWKSLPDSGITVETL